MSFTRERCAQCGQLMIGFDGKPATCINETCATDARARRAPRHPNREQFMEPFSLVYYLRFADRIKIGVTTGPPSAPDTNSSPPPASPGTANGSTAPPTSTSTSEPYPKASLTYHSKRHDSSNAPSWG